MKTQGHAQHLHTKMTEIQNYITHLKTVMSDDYFTVTMTPHKEFQFWNELSSQSKYILGAATDLRETAVTGMALAEKRYRDEEL